MSHRGGGEIKTDRVRLTSSPSKTPGNSPVDERAVRLSLTHTQVSRLAPSVVRILSSRACSPLHRPGQVAARESVVPSATPRRAAVPCSRLRICRTRHPQPIAPRASLINRMISQPRRKLSQGVARLDEVPHRDAQLGRWERADGRRGRQSAVRGGRAFGLDYVRRESVGGRPAIGRGADVEGSEGGQGNGEWDGQEMARVRRGEDMPRCAALHAALPANGNWAAQFDLAASGRTSRTGAGRRW